MTRAQFRESLLDKTLAWARGIPLYASLWPEDASLTGMQLLETLPTVDKALVQSSGPESLHPGRVASILLHTTGTSGTPFVRYRSEEELAAIAEYAARVQLAFASERSPNLTTFSLLDPTVHGGSLPSHPGRRVSIGISTPASLMAAMDLLSSEPLFPDQATTPVSLIGRPTQLLVLAVAMQEVGQSLTGRILEVASTGDHLTASTRSALERLLPAARIVNRYGLSEVFGGATQCQLCGFMHFDPHVIPEILSESSDKGDDDGRPPFGELVLTELYPFSQLQPLVRYRTRDMFARHEVPCSSDFGYEFLGRAAAASASVEQTPQLVYAPSRLRDLLESSGDIGRRNLSGAGSGRYFGLTLGEPLADVLVDLGSRRIVIGVALSCSPILYPALSENVATWLRREWPAVDPWLKRFLDEGASLNISTSDVSDSLGPSPLRLRQQMGIGE